ncbi:MAG: hypothetical protein ACHQNA_14580, partial [Acidimicrobiales bacterium]
PTAAALATVRPGPRERESLWTHAHRDENTPVSLTLDWDRASFHPVDDRTRQMNVPFPEHLAEGLRSSVAAALVSIEVVGGPIEDAKLSHSHIRLEITNDADMQDVRQLLQGVIDSVVPRADGASG